MKEISSRKYGKITIFNDYSDPKDLHIPKNPGAKIVVVRMATDDITIIVEVYQRLDDLDLYSFIVKRFSSETPLITVIKTARKIFSDVKSICVEDFLFRAEAQRKAIANC